MNVDLFDKHGKRITYVVLPASFVMGEDIQIGGCLFQLNESGEYITQNDPLEMFTSK